jgi:hypothetical protein
MRSVALISFATAQNIEYVACPGTLRQAEALTRFHQASTTEIMRSDRDRPQADGIASLDERSARQFMPISTPQEFS